MQGIGYAEPDSGFAHNERTAETPSAIICSVSAHSQDRLEPNIRFGLSFPICTTIAINREIHVFTGFIWPDVESTT